jgi:hypothetical protein
MSVLGQNSSNTASSFDLASGWGSQDGMDPCRGLGHHPSIHQEHSHGTISDASTGPEWTFPSTTISMDTVAMDAQQARDRAMAILRKFQATSTNNQRPHPRYDTGQKSQGLESNNTGSPHHPTGLILVSPEEYSRRRRACLDSLEERKRLSLLKSLEYVAHVEDERLRHQLDQIEQAKSYENLMDEHHRRRIQPSHAVSQSGIGTQQRQRLEQKRISERPGDRSNSSSSSLAIYVSNLPSDGSVDEHIMRSLFGSYGALRKIHFYGDKETGLPKGDALVIYNLQPGQDRISLTEAVCSQVSETFARWCGNEPNNSPQRKLSLVPPHCRRQLFIQWPFSSLFQYIPRPDVRRTDASCPEVLFWWSSRRIRRTNSGGKTSLTAATTSLALLCFSNQHRVCIPQMQ